VRKAETKSRVRGGLWRRIISHFSFGEVRETNLATAGIYMAEVTSVKQKLQRISKK
jgi:hypothetical protein